jgi:hypothetical protein
VESVVSVVVAAVAAVAAAVQELVVVAAAAAVVVVDIVRVVVPKHTDTPEVERMPIAAFAFVELVPWVGSEVVATLVAVPIAS